MKTVKIILIIGVVLGTLTAAYIWFFVYNKPHRNFEKAQPDVSLTAKECYEAFKSNPNIYTGKVVQLTGLPDKIESGDSLCVVVFVFNEGLFGDEGIRCTVLPKYNEACKNIPLKKPLTIKGFCVGFNDTDVVLNNCSIIKNKK